MCAYSPYSTSVMCAYSLYSTRVMCAYSPYSTSVMCAYSLYSTSVMCAYSPYSTSVRELVGHSTFILMMGEECSLLVTQSWWVRIVHFWWLSHDGRGVFTSGDSVMMGEECSLLVAQSWWVRSVHFWLPMMGEECSLLVTHDGRGVFTSGYSWWARSVHFWWLSHDGWGVFTSSGSVMMGEECSLLVTHDGWGVFTSGEWIYPRTTFGTVATTFYVMLIEWSVYSSSCNFTLVGQFIRFAAKFGNPPWIRVDIWTKCIWNMYARCWFCRPKLILTSNIRRTLAWERDFAVGNDTETKPRSQLNNAWDLKLV